MRLSAPIYRLKRKAKLLAREKNLPLHKALDRLAIAEGFQSWSHLASLLSRPNKAATILAQLEPGDLVLLGARPGHGKTLLGIELATEARQFGRVGFLFTLDYHEQDVAQRFEDLGIDKSNGARAIEIDTSDDISADYIIDRLRRSFVDVIVVVDYLQLLDQKRSNPSLGDQVDRLKACADTTGAIFVMISQINRSFDLSSKQMPDLSDVRLPNPFDLSVFDKSCFLHDGEIQLDAVA